MNFRKNKESKDNRNLLLRNKKKMLQKDSLQHFKFKVITNMTMNNSKI